MSKKVQDLVVNLTGLEPELKGWNTKESIGAERPTVSLEDNNNFYGDAGTRDETRKALSHHFRGAGVRAAPIVTDREVVANDFLIKNTRIIDIFKQSAPHMASVDMELAGVYSAARRMDREYPILSVRGISDIVGFKRDDRWTNYACETAAAFFFALLRVLPHFYL
jgi:nucleoside phosphorylase